MTARRPLVLAILDGFGIRSSREGNAIELARKPTIDHFLERYAHTQLEASGLRVGLPEGQMGNSEVGHLNMGAGRIVFQDLTQIDQSIRDGSFFTNDTLRQAMNHGRDTQVHLLGLVSDGGVHSHLSHLKALLELARRENIRNVYVHAFTDGRDSSPRGGAGYVRDLTDHMRRLNVGRIATVCGRYYAMDRDKRWDRTGQAYEAIVEGNAPHRNTDPVSFIEESYRNGVTDEFLSACVVVDSSGRPLARMQSNDSVIFFNFRADRARQLTEALTRPEFDGFSRPAGLVRHYATMTRYDQRYDFPTAFAPTRLDNILANVFAAQGLRNLRIAETEKYAHVSYFFNGGEEPPFAGERRILIPSPKVATYDLKPEMSAVEMTDRLLAELDARTDDCIILNFANADMVGHSGVIDAAVRAVETIDQCLGRLFPKIASLGGSLLVTADHGNAEQMLDPATGGPHTAHTSNPVPFIIVDLEYRGTLRAGGALEDVAPTMLGILGVEPPREMTGRSLIQAD
ncbi:MAG: 2,3-bisphosphoglycerate-independent phosphoglycerate mutase [Acidobacteriota bacterium]